MNIVMTVLSRYDYPLYNLSLCLAAAPWYWYRIKRWRHTDDGAKVISSADQHHQRRRREKRKHNSRCAERYYIIIVICVRALFINTAHGSATWHLRSSRRVFRDELRCRISSAGYSTRESWNSIWAGSLRDVLSWPPP